jgi:ribose transport system substrate-binding protein
MSAPRREGPLTPSGGGFGITRLATDDEPTARSFGGLLNTLAGADLEEPLGTNLPSWVVSVVMGVRAKTLAVVLHRLKAQAWSDAVRRDIETAVAGAALAGGPPIEVEFADPNGDSAEQVSILEGYLERRVDALIVMPIDPPATSSTLRKFREAKVPVVVVGNEVDDPDLFDACVLGNHRQFGREVGDFFASTMAGEGDLIEITGVAVSPITRDRSAGFREALAPYPRIRVVDACQGDWLYERALQEFPRLLERHQKLDGVFAHNDEMAAAVLEVARRQGREDELLVVGIDALPSAIKRVNEGRQAATFLYPSPGKDAVYAVLALLGGEPCMKQVLLKTWPYHSITRIRGWLKHRAARGGRPPGSGAAPGRGP